MTVLKPKVFERTLEGEISSALELFDEFTLQQGGPSIRALASLCGSELERILLPHLAFMPVPYEKGGWGRPVLCRAPKTDHKFSEGGEYAVLVCQMPVEQYRLDFALIYKPVTLKSPIRVAIECDGHDYHDGTKEAAERDKKRNREVTSLGWKMMRFSGREIYRNPNACATEVFKIILRAHQGKID